MKIKIILEIKVYIYIYIVIFYGSYKNKLANIMPAIGKQKHKQIKGIRREC